MYNQGLQGIGVLRLGLYSRKLVEKGWQKKENRCIKHCKKNLVTDSVAFL